MYSEGRFKLNNHQLYLRYFCFIKIPPPKDRALLLNMAFNVYVKYGCGWSLLDSLMIARVRIRVIPKPHLLYNIDFNH